MTLLDRIGTNNFSLIKTVLRYGRFYRIVPHIDFKENKTKKTLPLPWALTIYILFAAAHFSTHHERGMSRLVFIAVLQVAAEICFFLSFGCSLLTEYTMQDTWNLLLVKMKVLETTLEKYVEEIPFCKRILIVSLPVVLPYTIFFYDVWLVCVLEKRGAYILNFLSMYICFTYNFALASAMANLAMLATSVLTASRGFLRDNFRNSKSYVRSTDAVRETRQICSELKSIVDLSNSIFGFRYLLLDLSSCLLILVSGLKYTYFTKHSESVYRNYLMLFYCFLAMAYTFMITLCCQASLNASERLIEFCHELQEGLCIFSERRQELEDLVDYLTHCKVRYVPCNVYSINKPSIMSHLNTTLNYYILFYQVFLL